MVRLAGPPSGHSMLVERTYSHPRSERPIETNPEDPLGKKCHQIEEEGEGAHYVHQMGCHPGLGRVYLGATSQWPQTNSTGFRGIEPPLGNQPVE